MWKMKGWWKILDEYKAISEFYGDQCAKRSGVPLINHIDEGCEYLVNIRASGLAIRAYMLHPLFQNNQVWKDNFHRCSEFDPEVMMFVMEYRKCANAYLCKPHTDNYDLDMIAKVVDINCREVADMLRADKWQNHKDFLKYHFGTHERSNELNNYFTKWKLYLETVTIKYPWEE